jgi:hypothetical protein
MGIKIIFKFFLPVLFVIVTLSSHVFAMGVLPKLPIKKPPVIKPVPPPPSAPEPVTLTLIGMGASGAVGYYLGRLKKNNKISDS